ncbi:PHD finger domain protein [Aspergillus clavatus NRRL 1]|uniref:PHD finger domain protein n=1 Tax=Aspergillus clavatus (strain ATCC 1007 / CBS 513.65 / DSM 816 / NCTC 3887 / NRRL 1 / QM 1276 / 107) TaxID=344612 RepID=A1CNE9_ASPCL|nr:PHD finger domain protein [Aspergillus clavatus NRRL 1]EAW07170.1 PHD finger domain protein [Aspergillus clavatus NRRL 1]
MGFIPNWLRDKMKLTEPPITFSFSYPNGEPQTPTRTPTTTIFGDSAFQTPKLESSFFDPRVTWDTSDPYASSPEFLRTPRFGLSTPSKPLHLPDTIPGRATGPDATQGLEQETDTAKRIRPARPNGGSGEDGPRTVDSAKSAASIQTPPPSSASRRKITGLENVADMERKTSPPGGHLETPSRVLGASPRFFAGLQSSPDPFQLATIDSSGSPFFPQQRLFWDHDLGQHEAGLGLPVNSMDPFNTDSASTGLHHSNILHDARIPQLPSIDANLELPEIHGNTYGLPTAPSDAALFPAPFSTSPRLPMTKVEDPALFLSSPARRFGGPHLSPARRLFSQPARQPYHHQTEEFKREELRRAQSTHRLNPGYDEDEDDDDEFTPRRVRPGLTRSVTHTAVTAASHRSVSGQSSSGMMASTSGIRKSPSKGRLSPIKSSRHQLRRANSAAAGLPRRSQSVVLRIGKDGRAMTEMQTVPEAHTGLTDPVSGMELDGSITESDYESPELSDYPVLPNRNPSFVFSDAGRPTIARSDSGSRPQSKGSYTSTAASSQSGRASPWSAASRGPVRRPMYRAPADEWNRTTPKRQSMLINSDVTYPSGGSNSGLLPDSEEDSGDAQHALRKVLAGRGRIPRSQTVGYGSRSNRSSVSLAHLHSSPPRFGAELDLNSRAPNTSPTTMTDPDIATPTTERYSNPSNGTRCVCRSMDNGGHLMIQW